MHRPSACEICVFRWSAKTNTHPFSCFFLSFLRRSLTPSLSIFCVRLRYRYYFQERGVYGRQCADFVLTVCKWDKDARVWVSYATRSWERARACPCTQIEDRANTTQKMHMFVLIYKGSKGLVLSIFLFSSLCVFLCAWSCVRDFEFGRVHTHNYMIFKIFSHTHAFSLETISDSHGLSKTEVAKKNTTNFVRNFVESELDDP